jgi:hypothetical protein
MFKLEISNLENGAVESHERLLKKLKERFV